MSILPEEWRPVPGLDNYSVSNQGRVLGPRGKVLKLNISQGYYRFGFYDKLSQRMSYLHVHQAVAFAFLGPIPYGMVVCHGPKGKSVNSIDNLYYATQAHNCGPDRVRDGTINRGTMHGKCKLTETDVKDIRLDPRSCTAIGRHYGVNVKTIWSIKKRKTWAWLD